MDKSIKLEATISNRESTFSYDYTMTVPNDGLTPIMEGLLQKGFGEVLRDCFSTFTVSVDTPDGKKTKRDATPAEKHTATNKRLTALVDGSYVFGGRGPTLSPDEKAMKAALVSKGVKFAKGVTVGEALVAYTEALAASQDKEFNAEEMVPKVAAALEASEVYKTTLDAIKAQTTQDTNEIEL